MSNFIISLHGRGASYAFMLQGVEVDECVQRCHPCLQSGFEVFIYSIEPSPTGQPGFTPTGAVNLRRHFHLYDAHDEYEQEAQDIIDRLSVHSIQASQEYLDIMIKSFQAEKEKLNGEVKDREMQANGRLPNLPTVVPSPAQAKPSPGQDGKGVPANQPSTLTPTTGS